MLSSAAMVSVKTLLTARQGSMISARDVMVERNPGGSAFMAPLLRVRVLSLNDLLCGVSWQMEDSRQTCINMPAAHSVGRMLISGSSSPVVSDHAKGNRLLKNHRSNLIMDIFGEVYAV